MAKAGKERGIFDVVETGRNLYKRPLIATAGLSLLCLGASAPPDHGLQLHGLEQQGHPQQAPPVFQLLPASKTAEDLRSDRADEAEKKAAERHMEWLTVALTLIGALQLLVFWYQALKLRQTVRDGRLAIGTATEAANAAKRQSELTADTAKRQLRAYIGVASAQVHYDSGRPEDCFIEVRIKNYGQTPAYDVISKWGEHVREWPLTSQLPAIPEIPHSIAPLPPGRESIQRVPISHLNTWEEEQLKAGCGGIYFWSLVTYVDVYGDSHLTRVQLVCEGDGLRSGHMHPFGEREDNAAT